FLPAAPAPSGAATAGKGVPADPGDAPPVPLAAADRARLLGAYLDRESLQIRTLTLDHGELALGFVVGAGGPPTRPLEAIGPRTVRVKGTTATYELVPGSGRVPDWLVRRIDDETTAFERFEPVTVREQDLAEYCGRYRSPETTRDLAVEVVEGALAASPWGKRPAGATTRPAARDVFVEPSGGMRFERDRRGKVNGLVSYFGGFPAVRWTKVE
ncbi:MAG TPA: hypothetical protein VIY73_10290, partial [Polyangiaceae bacterium]